MDEELSKEIDLLINLTNPNHPDYNPTFVKGLNRISPDWFDKIMILAKENKDEP